LSFGDVVLGSWCDRLIYFDAVDLYGDAEDEIIRRCADVFAETDPGRGAESGTRSSRTVDRFGTRT
jgi:hypothetical protein